MKPNAYQVRKAKQIANFLLECREQSTLGRLELAKVVAIMDANQWRTVSFAAGVPVADLLCKAAVLALLRGALDSRRHKIRVFERQRHSLNSRLHRSQRITRDILHFVLVTGDGIG